MNEAKPINVIELLTRASILVGLMSTFCYAFGVGFIFQIEPRFLPAFSVTDLIFLFASSTSYLIFLIITLVPSLGLLAATPQARALFSSPASRGPAAAHREEAEAPLVKPGRVLPLILAGTATVITGVIGFLDVQDALSDVPFVFFTLPDFILAAGIALILASFSANRYWRAVAPLVLIVYLLAAFYVFGAILGYRDLRDTADGRGLPCAFIDSSPDCFDLIAIGSDVALMRSRGRAVIVPRSRVRSVQGRHSVAR